MESHPATTKVDVNTFWAYFDIYTLGCGLVEVRGYGLFNFAFAILQATMHLCT